MTGSLERRPRFGIQTRLIVYYTIFAIVTVAFVAIVAYAQAASSLRATVEDKLATVAGLKMDFLNQWVDDQQRNIIFLASLPELRALSGTLLDPASSDAGRTRAQEDLTSLMTIIAQRSADIQDVEILSEQGIIVASVHSLNVGRSQADQAFFLEGKSKTYTQNFYRSDLFDKTTLTIATPLFDNQERRVGVFVLHFNMRQVDNILQVDQGSETDVRSYLVTRRHEMITDDPILLGQSNGIHSPAIDTAVAGGQGIESYQSHDGRTVIGKYVWIENQNAALIVEIDEATALWPARRLALVIISTGSVLSILLVFIVIALARQITAPLRSLIGTVSRVSSGQLDASAPVHSHDEVGTLARSFNSMTDTLRQTLDGLQAELRERQQTEAALRESEERFRKVFDFSPIAICITSLADGRFLDANYAYWDLSGLDPKTALGRAYSDLNIRYNAEERMHFVEKIKQRRSIYDADYTFKDVRGNGKPTLAFYELIQLGGEECVLSMFYDMSAQKQALQALRQSEARTRALLEAFPDMIIELSADGMVLNMIPPKGMEVSMPSEMFVGRHVSDVFSPTVASQTVFAVGRAIETSHMNIFEFEETMNGTSHTMEARFVASSPTAALMLVRDVTQRKWVEEERERVIDQLEANNAELETLRESLASIVSTFEFGEIVQRILDQIRRVVPYDTASVWRVDGQRQIFIGGRDLPAEVTVGLEFFTDHDNSAIPIINGESPYILNNAVQDELPDFKNSPHTYVNSWLAVPLKTRGRVIGLIALDGKQKDQFTEHHAKLAVTFANQVAIALDNASLFSELQLELENRKSLIAELEVRNTESETMGESLATILGTLEFSEVIRRILDQIKRVVPYDSVSVWRLEGNKQVLIGERGLPSELSAAGLEFNLDEQNHAMPIFRAEVPYLISQDVQSEFPRFQESPHTYINSWLGVPLKSRGRVVGLIALDGFRKGQFNEHHAQLAVTFADHVAIALENARLFSDLQAELVARKELIAELESKNSELERFTYTVSHDLKSPLFTIRGFLGYLEQDALAGNLERMKSDMQRITDATEKMQRLLNELLELSRIGRLRNEPERIPFGDLAREAVELAQGYIMQRRVSVSIQPGLPEVVGDRQRLLEVLQNLVDNAAKFMGNQHAPHIEIGQEGEENGNPVFFVRDNGIGIAPEYHERVFGLFNKLDVKSDGTGIGLALVKRIVEVHGGRIWVRSEAGAGSTFYFTLAGRE